MQRRRIVFPLRDNQRDFRYTQKQIKEKSEAGEGRGGRSEVECWGLACTSTAMLKSTMDTLVFLCQHTCTMVLPRCGVGLSNEVCEAAMSSSDSASTEESSGHSGKVRRSLLLDNEQGDVGRRELEHRQRQIILKSNIVLYLGFHSVGI